MKSLLKQLWFQSNNCADRIENMGIQVSEVSKSTGKPNKEIIIYLNFLTVNRYINRISNEPLLYEFTDLGRKIKSDSDIGKLINNVA